MRVTFNPLLNNTLKYNTKNIEDQDQPRAAKTLQSLPAYDKNSMSFGMANISAAGLKQLDLTMNTIVPYVAKFKAAISDGDAQKAIDLYKKILELQPQSQKEVRDRIDKCFSERAKDVARSVGSEYTDGLVDFATECKKEIPLFYEDCTLFSYAVEKKEPKTAEKILDYVKTLAEEEQDRFALFTNSREYSHMKMNNSYMLTSRLGIKFIDFVKTLSPETKEKFVRLTTSGYNKPYSTEIKNDAEMNLFLKYLDLVKTLKPEAKGEFLLNSTREIFDYHNLFLKCLDLVKTLKPEVQNEFALNYMTTASKYDVIFNTNIRKFLDFVKTLKPETKKECAQDYINTSFLFIKNRPDIALATFDFIKTLEPDLQKQFAKKSLYGAMLNSDKAVNDTAYKYIEALDTATQKEILSVGDDSLPAILKQIVGYTGWYDDTKEALPRFMNWASKAMPLELSKWKLPSDKEQKLQQSPAFSKIVQNVISSPELNKQETLEFLDRCKYFPEAQAFKEIVEKHAK